MKSIASTIASVCLAAIATTASSLADDQDLIWGVNGHPLVSYPGVSLEEQVGLLAQLGASQYRVDISSVNQAAHLATLIEVADSRGITVLPVLIPPAKLDQDAGTVYLQSRRYAEYYASRFPNLKVWELGNEMENYAILQPCEIRDDGTVYNCEWGPAAGVTPLEYHGGRWSKVSAALKGMSDGIHAILPDAKRAIGTAGWGHVGAFERMVQDGIGWDITVWHHYGDDPEWGLSRIAKFGKPIWITEFNHPYGSKKDGVVGQARGLVATMKQFRALKKKHKVEAAHIYELLDETYWLPDFEAHMGLVYLNRDGKGQWRTTGKKPAFCAVKALINEGSGLAASESGLDVSAADPARPARSCNLCYHDPCDMSPENRIRYSYCLVLGRDAEPTEMTQWQDRLANDGDALADLLKGLTNTREFHEKYSQAYLGESDYVAKLYRLLLDRPADGHGLNDFTAALAEGRMSRAELAASLIGSDEFRANHSLVTGRQCPVTATPAGG